MSFKKKDQEDQSLIVFEILSQNDQSHKISSVDIIIDPKSSRPRKVELREGASTIFADEMQGFESELPFVNLMFFNRRLEIQPYDKLALDFLRITDQNSDKENRMAGKKPPIFKELKPRQDAKEKLEKAALANKAETMATNCSLEEMLPFAHVLGINVDQFEDDVRLEFIQIARVNPTFFMKWFDNPKNTRQYNASLALKKNIITIDGGVAIWVASKKKIVEVPVDRRQDEFLAEYSTTDEGQKFYDALKKLL